MKDMKSKQDNDRLNGRKEVEDKVFDLPILRNINIPKSTNFLLGILAR